MPKKNTTEIGFDYIVQEIAEEKKAIEAWQKDEEAKGHFISPFDDRLISGKQLNFNKLFKIRGSVPN